MLRFLLDEHISPVVAEQAKRKCTGIDILTIHHWRKGHFLGAKDSVFLPEAIREGFTLVSYDQRTIRPLLRDWIEQGVDHTGIIFIDERSIPPNDFGGLVRALSALWKSERHSEWKNRVVFLRPPHD